MSTSLWAAKQLVHGFHVEASGLGDEEEDEQDGDGEEGSEDEVGAAADVGDHVGDAAGDDKVHQPVRGRAERHADATDPQREDLGAVDPGHARPREAESDRVDVDQCARCVAPGRDALGRARVARQHVPANVPHARRHERRPVHQHLGPAEAVDHERHGDHDGDEAYDPVDAGRVQSGAAARQADGFEDAW